MDGWIDLVFWWTGAIISVTGCLSLVCVSLAYAMKKVWFTYVIGGTYYESFYAYKKAHAATPTHRKDE